MGVRVEVRPKETIAQALHRLQNCCRKERHRLYKWYGPMKWMLVSKEYYQKPSVLRRMKLASMKARARMKAPLVVEQPRRAAFPIKIRDDELDRLTQ